MKDRQQTIRGRLVVTDLIVQELSSGVVIHVVNRETWVEWRTSSLQLEFRVFIKYETAELYRRPDIPYGHQLISDHLVPCMVSTEHENALSVLALLPPQVSMCHNFNKTARQDIPLPTCHYIPISAWQYISIFQHNIYLIRKAVGASNIFPSTTWIRWALHTAVWNHNDVDHHHHYHLFRQLTLMFWSNSFWSSSSHHHHSHLKRRHWSPKSRHQFVWRSMLLSSTWAPTLMATLMKSCTLLCKKMPAKGIILRRVK